MNSNHFEGNPIIALIGLGAGIYFFWAGFRELQAKRIIQNIPTSRINTGAVGTNVEVTGRIVSEKDQIVNAPISGRPCAFYSIEIQQWERNRSSRNSLTGSHRTDTGFHRGHWKTIDRFYSGKGFFIDDKSGANAMVLAEGAVVKRKGETRDLEIHSNSKDSIPGPLMAALEKNKNKLRRFRPGKGGWLFSSNRYRFREWHFSVGENIFVIGHAASGLKAPKRNTLKFKTFLKAKKKIQQDEKLKARFDTNKDGKLDEAELERGAKIVAQHLESEYSKEKLEDLASKTKMVFKHKKTHPFYISNMSEKELIRDLGTWSTLKIWGGPILSTGCAVYLFMVFFP